MPHVTPHGSLVVNASVEQLVQLELPADRLNVFVLHLRQVDEPVAF